MSISRRQLIKGAVYGGLGLAVGTLLIPQDHPSTDDEGWHFLTAEDRLVLHTVLLAMLSGTGADEEAIEQTLRRMDLATLYLTPGTRRELRQLFDLLANRWGRLLFTGLWSQWSQVSPVDMSRVLERWRNSALDLLQVAYQGLHELVFASFYAAPENWRLTGYPGPPELE